MRIFISSLISGFGAFRNAARSAVQSLGHAAVMTEDFGALTTSPQIACMEGVRSSDLVVLTLGGDYGFVQGTSGVSPTEEEYLEARGAKPILLFVQGGVAPDARQAKLLDDAQGWQTGQFRESFRSPDELREKITLAIHRYELATAAGPLDPASLISAAAAALPCPRRSRSEPPGVRRISWTGYAMSPRLLRYSTGLRAPREILIRFSLYQRMYVSKAWVNCSTLAACQSRG